jgi:DNA-binding NarL/FixJ family response regulator
MVTDDVSPPDRFRALLIEDDPDDALLIRDILADAEPIGVELFHESHLEAGLRRLRTPGVDLVLLDLSLPDAQGIDTLRRLRRARPDLPVVVLTGTDDTDTALRAVRSGAQDYLVKGRFGDDTLIRAMRYAVERHRLRERLEEARQRERRERELRELDRLAPPAASSPAADAADTPLRDRAPEAHATLRRSYDRLLSRSLRARLFRTDADLSAAARDISDRLRGLGAGARDVVALHAEVIQERTRRGNPEKIRACIEEGRMLLLQLLGYLADGYRRRTTAEPPSDAEAGEDAP